MPASIVRIRPLEFVHVLDQNKNIPILEVGPQTRTLQTHETLLGGPFPFVVVPLGHYCKVKDPCINYKHGEPCEYKHGEFDVRLHKKPFPLYPGETLVGAEKFGQSSSDYSGALRKLPVIPANHGLRLMARVDHEDDDGLQRKASEEWQLEGPMTYIPTSHVGILQVVTPHILGPRQALRLRAKQDCEDKNGRKRVTGEEWLVTTEGAYLAGVYEELAGVEEAITLTARTAVHLKALCTLTDSLDKQRQAGEQWMVTVADTELLYPEIGVEVMDTVSQTVLSKNQFCVVVDPVDSDGRPQLGKKEVRHGIRSFFLHPGESLKDGIQDSYVLGADEAVVLQALEEFEDKSCEGATLRKSGERWMIVGPCAYIPQIEVEVVNKRKAIPLAKNEGVYVRDIQTGKIRAVMGPRAYMLTAYEELWSKPLTEEVCLMLQQGGGLGAGDIRKIAYFEQSIDPARQEGPNSTQVVTYRCPHNTACQVYDHMKKQVRVVFGPNLVILGPHEDFTVLSLSAGKPKKSNALKSLALMLGPDFITDILQVETLDHARLQIQLAFNNHFEVDKNNPKSARRIFAVPDFIGFACRKIGSRIRGKVAQVTFDEFHRHSSQVIQAAVFGMDEDNKINKSLLFTANNLVVTGIDVQSIEPVDKKMRDSLMKSIQMAIEIATSSIERSARHEAECLEQIARGKLERAKLLFEKEAEKERTKLVELRATTAAVESTGQAVAEAQAKRESMIIECKSEIELERLKAQAMMIEHRVQLIAEQKSRALDLAYNRALNEEEVHKLQQITEIDVRRFTSQVNSLGVTTITAITTAGPALQASLLEGLGLKSTLITDGKTPVNLFDTIHGLVPVRD